MIILSKGPSKARPAKSGKKFNGPKVGFNLGCCAFVSYIQNQLDETRRWARFGQLWKITSKIAGLGWIHGALAQNLYTI